MSTGILILFFLTCLVTWAFTLRALTANPRDIWAWVLAVIALVYVVYAVIVAGPAWPLVGAVLGAIVGAAIGLLGRPSKSSGRRVADADKEAAA